MTPDLIARLRLIAAWHTPGGATPKEDIPSRHKTALEAADAIATLSRKLEIAEKALEPFAFIANTEERTESGASVMVNVNRCRDAREALATLRGEG